MLVMCFQVTVAHLIISVLLLLLVLGGIIGLLLKPHLEEGGKSLYGGLSLMIVGFPNWHVSGYHFQEQVGWGT